MNQPNDKAKAAEPRPSEPLREALKDIFNYRAIRGNANLQGCEEFYRGYNAGLRQVEEVVQGIANRALAAAPVPVVARASLVRQKQKSGCTVAAIAMVTGLTYEQVAAHSKRDFDNDGVQLHDWDEFLNDRGFAICLKYKVTHLQGVNTYRPVWPLPPFAPIHLCSVQSSTGAHAVVMLANGDVLDPAKDGVHKLTDYQDVHSIAGVWQIAAPALRSEEPSGEPVRDQQFTKLVDMYIDQLADEGCSCDVMNGYSCGIHKIANELRAALASRSSSEGQLSVGELETCELAIKLQVPIHSEHHDCQYCRTLRAVRQKLRVSAEVRAGGPRTKENSMKETDPNFIHAHEQAQKFIKEHPNVPVVDVPTVDDASRSAPAEVKEE